MIIGAVLVVLAVIVAAASTMVIRARDETRESFVAGRYETRLKARPSYCYGGLYLDGWIGPSPPLTKDGNWTDTKGYTWPIETWSIQMPDADAARLDGATGTMTLYNPGEGNGNDNGSTYATFETTSGETFTFTTLRGNCA